MNGGSENFVTKDIAFYNSKMTAALGRDVLLVYEELRRAVWRSTDSGGAKVRKEVREGRLSANILRKNIAASLGCSLGLVRKGLNRLREVGWVRTSDGHRKGEGLIYELGYTILAEVVNEKGKKVLQKVEVFYADEDTREFCALLRAKAEERGSSKLSALTIEERVELGREWLLRADRSVWALAPGVPVPGRTWGASPRRKVTQRPTVGHQVTSDPPAGVGHQVTSVINHSTSSSSPTSPSGTPETPSTSDRIDQSEKDPARCARDRSSDQSDGSIRGAEQGPQDEDSGKSPVAGYLTVEQRIAAAQKAQAQGAAKAKAQVTVNATKRKKRGRARLYRVWSEVMLQLDPHPSPKWGAKTWTQVKTLVDTYDEAMVELAMRYVVGNWDTIAERYFKNKAAGFPSIGLLLSLHESFFREARLWAEHRGVLEEYEVWLKANPQALRAPSELQQRVDKARADLKAIGVAA
jgi:ribosomal protein S25